MFNSNQIVPVLEKADVKAYASKEINFPHMKTIKATEARSNIYKLIDEVAESNEPIKILGKRNNALLVSEEEWESMEETIYLLGIPGMADKLIEGVNTPLEECEEIDINNL